jgi:hypothetical protein
MANFQKPEPEPESARRSKRYRLAWIGRSAENPNTCGPSFGSVKEAQDAAPDFNAARIARDQVPCNYIVEYRPRRDSRSRDGWRKLPTDLFHLDGTRQEVGRIKLGADPFDASRIKRPT